MRRIEMKCRRCGEVDVSCIAKDEEEDLNHGAMVAHFSPIRIMRPYRDGDEMYVKGAHKCNDGGIGVFEFQGLTPDKDEKEEKKNEPT